MDSIAIRFPPDVGSVLIEMHENLLERCLCLLKVSFHNFCTNCGFLASGANRSYTNVCWQHQQISNALATNKN